MGNWQERTIASLEKRFGYQISYDRIRPTILVSLEISNVQLGEQETSLLTLQRLLVRYNLFRLLRGDIEHAVSEVVIINSTLSLDTERDRELLSLFSSGRQEGSLFRLPQVPDLAISGKNISLNYRSALFSFSMDKLFFSLNGGDKPAVDGRGDLTFTARGVNGSSAPVSWKSGVRVSGSWSGEDTALVIIALKDLESSILSLPAVRLQANLDNQSIRITKIADRIPLDLTLSHNFDSSVSEIELLMESFQPSTFLNLRGKAEAAGPWLYNEYDGSLSMLYRHDSGTLDYNGDLSARIRHTSGIELPFPVDHQVHIQASGDMNSVNIRQLRVTSHDMDVSLQGTSTFQPLTMQTDISIRRLDLAGGTVRGAGALRYDGYVFRLRSDTISYNNLELEEMEALIVPDYDGSIDFSLNAYFPHPEKEKRGFIFAEGELGYGEFFFLDSSVIADSIPLSHFFPEIERRGFAVPDSIPEPFLDASLFFSTDGNRLSYSISRLSLRDEETERYFRLTGAGTLEEHNISSFEGRWGAYNVKGAAEVSLGQKSLLVSSDFSLNETGYGFSAYYDFGRSLILSGEHGTRLTARFGDTGVYIAAEAESFPFPFSAEESSELSFSLYGQYADPRSWQLVLDSLSFEGTPPFDSGPARRISIEAGGTVDNERARLTRLSYDDGTAPLEGSLSLDYPLNNPFKSEGWLSLSAPGDSERYLGSFALAEESLAAELSVESVPLTRLGLQEASGRISGIIVIGGSYSDPDFSIDARLTEGELNDNPLELEVVAAKKERVLILEYARGRYNSHVIQKLNGGLDFETGSVNLNGEYRPQSQIGLQSAAFILDGTSEEIPTLFDLPSAIHSPFRLRIDLVSIITGEGEKDPQSYLLEREKDTISISGGPGNLIAGYYNRSGDFRLTLDKPLPVSGSMSGIIGDKNITSDITINKADLSFLEGIADIGFFALKGGTATGSIKVRGSLNDPSFAGSVSVIGASASSSLLPDELSLFDAFIRINDKKVSVIAEPIRSGEATLDASVELTLERWLPQAFKITIKPEGENGVKTEYAIPNGGVDVTGFSKGVLIIEGSPGVLRLSGDLTVTNAAISLKNEQSARSGRDRAERRRRKNDFFLDLSITTGRKVEFFWPTVSFPILRSFAQTNQKMNISFNSQEETFSLRGDIAIQGGEISYLQRNFLISRGAISFNESADRFDPRLSVEAVLREMDETGEPIKIFLAVNNQPLSRFEPRFSSEPAMSDAEIIAILGAALPSRIGQEAIDLTAGLALTGSLVTQLGIVGSFESRVKEVLNVDLFSVRTQMIQNLILDRVGGAFSSEEYVGADFSQYLDNTTIFLGKYFGNDLFIQGTLQIQANQFTEQIVRQNDLFIDSEISLEWKTPLFLLELAVRPDFESPLESINNTSLGLSWGFSY
jgi:hypothetical protein